MVPAVGPSASNASGRRAPGARFKRWPGFRSGLVYGYDRRLGWVAEELPILPYGQPVLLARAGPLTVDLTYTWVVFSFTFGAALW